MHVKYKQASATTRTGLENSAPRTWAKKMESIDDMGKSLIMGLLRWSSGNIWLIQEKKNLPPWLHPSTP